MISMFADLVTVTDQILLETAKKKAVAVNVAKSSSLQTVILVLMATMVTLTAVNVTVIWMELMDIIAKRSTELALANITLMEIIVNNVLVVSSHSLSVKLANATPQVPLTTSVM